MAMLPQDDTGLFDLHALCAARVGGPRSEDDSPSSSTAEAAPATPNLARRTSPAGEAPFSPLLCTTLSPRSPAPMSFCWLHSKKRALEFLEEIGSGSGQFRCIPGNECKSAVQVQHEDGVKAARGATPPPPSPLPAAIDWSPALPPSLQPHSPTLPSLAPRRVSFGPQAPATPGPFSPNQASQSSAGLSPGMTPEGPREGREHLADAFDEFILRSAEEPDLPLDFPLGIDEADDPRKPKRGKKKKKGIVEENPALDPMRYKTKLCKNWQLHEKCCYGPRCLFAHGHRELRAYGPPRAPGGMYDDMGGQAPLAGSQTPYMGGPMAYVSEAPYASEYYPTMYPMAAPHPAQYGYGYGQ